MSSYRDTRGTVHVAPTETESGATFFRRVARDKPDPPPNGRGRCHICGQDHRGPREFWPAREARQHDYASWMMPKPR